MKKLTSNNTVSHFLTTTNKLLKVTDEHIGYKALIENSLVGVYIIQNNKFKYVNKRFCEIFGYKREEIVNHMDLLEIVYEEDKRLVSTNLRKRMNHRLKSIEYEFRGQKKNGTVIWLKVLGSFIQYKNTPSITGTVIDITESKKNAEELKISEERLRITLENTQIGIWDWDVINDKWYVSPIYYTMLGYPIEYHQTDRSAWLSRIHPDDRKIIRHKIFEVLHNKTNHYENEVRMRHADGSYRWQHITGHAVERNKEGEITRMVGTRKDIHQIKTTEQKLNQNQHLLCKLMDTIPDLVWLKDDKGSFLACNKRFEELLGKPKVDIIGKNDYYFMTKERADFFRGKDLKAILTRKPICNEEILYFADGHEEIVETIKTPLFHEDNSTLGVLGIGRNITERKQIEEERKRIHADLEKRVALRTSQLKQANDDLESFTYSVSHDLKAPLRHLDGFLRLLKNEVNLNNDPVRNYIDKLEISSNRMSILIDELLKFSRLGRTQLTLKKVEIEPLIHTIIEQSKPDFDHRKIDWIIHDVPNIWADPALIKVVFENLISNAIKYTSKKEIATIEIGENTSSDKTTICLFIKDNGAGFNMEFKDKLFGVFQRLHSNDQFNGIGIGLATVKQIINKHHGEISAQSKVNHGATFYIRLPRQPPDDSLNDH